MEIDGVILRDKERRLSISRVPKKTKELFIQFAKEEFAEDYGLCLKWCLEQAFEYQEMKNAFFENINFKLDNILGKFSQNEEIPETSREIKMLSGKKISLKTENRVDKEVKKHE